MVGVTFLFDLFEDFKRQFSATFRGNHLHQVLRGVHQVLIVLRESRNPTQPPKKAYGLAEHLQNSRPQLGPEMASHAPITATALPTYRGEAVGTNRAIGLFSRTGERLAGSSIRCLFLLLCGLHRHHDEDPVEG